MSPCNNPVSVPPPVWLHAPEDATTDQLSSHLRNLSINHAFRTAAAADKAERLGRLLDAALELMQRDPTLNADAYRALTAALTVLLRREDER